MAAKNPKRAKPSPKPASLPTPTVPESPSRRQLLPVVGVGASAGGLEAFTDFLKHLPRDSGMAFVLIQHLDPKQHSQLTELLAKTTRMSVVEVTADSTLKPDTVYVIAPGTLLRLSDGRLRIEPRGTSRDLPIDRFLRSLALENGSNAIGVVLSGTASDGTLGLKTIKSEGGVTFVQEPSTAKFDGMPRSAIAAGVADFVLPPAEIARRVARLKNHLHSGHAESREDDADQEAEVQLNRLFHLLRTVTGNDFSHYKAPTIRRRIHRRMVLHAVQKLGDYVAFLHDNPAEVRAMADDLLISVTSFFRDEKAFEILSTKVFPRLLDKRSADDPIRVWVAGCATGEEAYSIAICLAEFLEQHTANIPVQLFATDVSESAIEKARVGIYGLPSLAEVSPARLEIANFCPRLRHRSASARRILT